MNGTEQQQRSARTATNDDDRWPRTADPPQSRPGPIIVAVGASADPALLAAARMLAPMSAGGVLVASAVEALPTFSTGFEPTILPPTFDSDRADDRVAAVKARVQEVAGTDSGWNSAVSYGEPSYVISDLARARLAPLIVMGIGRHRPLERLLGGETTLRTIRRATCPVLAVGPHFDTPLRRVVVATDFSASSMKAAESVLPFVAADATLHLVHAWDPNAPADARLSLVDRAYLLGLPDKFRRLRAMLSLPKGVTVQEVVREGKPGERVLDYASTISADLIVAGRHGMNVLTRLLVGSVSTTILRAATCSVLIAPEPTVADRDRFGRIFEGSRESSSPEEWAVQLDAFARRNQGRRTTVEVDDYVLGGHVMETGYALQGAAYDPHDHRIELMFGDPGMRSRHVTRAIANAESIVITSDHHGRDTGLRVVHSPGQTVLTFPAVAD